MSDEIAGPIPAVRDAEIRPIAAKDRPDLTGVHLRLHLIHQEQETTVEYVIPAKLALQISERLAREARIAVSSRVVKP